MPKLIERSGTPIGDEGLLRLIDDVNVMRAQSGQRWRLRPVRRDDGVLEAKEHVGVPRPQSANTPSPRYCKDDQAWMARG